MIARIRRGNDFHVAWQIKRGGVPENLENVTDIKLERTIYGVTTEHTLFTVSGDTITAEIPAEVQTHNGQYKLTLSYELVDTGMSDDDRKCKVAIYAFAIVDPLGPADDLLTVNVSSDVTIGLKGDKGLSAYQVWLENGNVGTEDDYFAYLRQPATDAATTANTAAGDANDAASAANTAAGLANNAATTANTAAGLADTARTELTTAVNTKLGEADDKIEEMDTTLSTYDGRVTQVEADIDQLAGNTVPKLKSDLIKFVLGEDIDLETKPALTDGYYINVGGGLSPSASAYSSTLDFIPLYGAKKLHYFGRFGNSNTRLGFYSGTSENTKVLAVPESNREIFDEIFDIPVEAKYYRVTCGIDAKNNFKVVLIGVGSSLKLESFRYVGAPVYENDAIKQSNIIWNDGSSGVVIFNNWNEENSTFTSFVATSIENGVTVTQPEVTFNSNNQITNYPNFIISEI